MKRAQRVLHFLQAVVRPFGFAHFDDKGRMTAWYAVSVFYFSVEIAAKILYLERITTTKSYFSSRPVQLMLVMIISLISVGNSFSNLLHVRHPLTVKDYQKVERLLWNEKHYSLKFIFVDIIIVSALKICQYIIMCHDWVASKILPLHQIIIFVLARPVPELLTYIGAMHYCYLLQIFKDQLCGILKCRSNRVKLSFMHNHLLRCCTALQRTYRHQLMFCVFGTILNIIWDLIFVHERLLSFLREESSIHQSLLYLANLAFSFLKLFNICKTMHSVQVAVDNFMMDSFLYLESDGAQMNHALLAYVISRPRFSTSIGGYLNANMSLLITITSSTGLYYLLMVQMNIIQSKYVS